MGSVSTIELVGPPGRVVVNECDCDAYIASNGGSKKWQFVNPKTNKPTKTDPRTGGATSAPPADSPAETPTPDPEV